jgi:hypothetical protein
MLLPLRRGMRFCELDRVLQVLLQHFRAHPREFELASLLDVVPLVASIFDTHEQAALPERRDQRSSFPVPVAPAGRLANVRFSRRAAARIRFTFARPAATRLAAIRLAVRQVDEARVRIHQPLRAVT